MHDFMYVAMWRVNELINFLNLKRLLQLAMFHFCRSLELNQQTLCYSH